MACEVMAAVMEPQEIEDEEHEQILERVAAVDVAKAAGMVCTRVHTIPAAFATSTAATRSRICSCSSSSISCGSITAAITSHSTAHRVKGGPRGLVQEPKG